MHVNFPDIIQEESKTYTSSTNELNEIKPHPHPLSSVSVVPHLLNANTAQSLAASTTANQRRIDQIREPSQKIFGGSMIKSTSVAPQFEQSFSRFRQSESSQYIHDDGTYPSNQTTAGGLSSLHPPTIVSQESSIKSQFTFGHAPSLQKMKHTCRATCLWSAKFVHSFAGMHWPWFCERTRVMTIWVAI